MTVGCKKEPSFQSKKENAAQNQFEATDRNGTGATVIGLKQTNPYKVEVIKQAYNNLYEPDITTLLPNYLYVRFLPTTPADVKKLLESGLEFTDFPLDYEILNFGERYHDPSVSDSTYTWEYAVIDVNSPMPNVQHQILEELALVSEDCAIAQEAFRLTGNAYEAPETLEANPTIVANRFDFHIDHEDPKEGETGARGGDCNCPLPNNKRKPSGCVQVFDNMLNVWEGVINVEVHTSKTHIFGAIFHRETETDINGCWKINHKYYGYAHVWVKWVSSTVDIKTMNTDVDLWNYTFPRKAYIGKLNGPNFNNIPIMFDFTTALGSWNFRNWVASSANNSVYEFGNFVTSQSITRRVPENLKILITPWGGGGNTGAAPMLDKMGAIQQFILYTNANTLLVGLFSVIAPQFAALSLPIATWIEIAAPDIAMNLNDPSDVNSDDIREIMYHELSHALHFDQVGSTYWLINIAYVIFNLGYGDGTANHAGRCSVIESWGFHIGMIATHNRYGISNSNPGIVSFTTWRARLENGFAIVNPINGTPHIPFAWEWDIQDNNGTNPPNEQENPIVNAAGGDRVLGITEAQIFGVMTSSLVSMPQMKSSLAPLLPASVPIAQYNTLCDAYGF